MAKLLKLRRGTTTQHASFTGAEGEVTIDTTKDTAVVHDGAQAGGRPLAREDMSNVSSASIAGRLGTDSISVDKIAAGTLPNDVKVNSNSIINQAIINEDVSNSANIANSKLADSGVTAGAYGSSSAIPIVTVNAKGVVTAASTTSIDSTRIDNGNSNVRVNNNANILVSRNGTDRLEVTNSGIEVTGDIVATGDIKAQGNDIRIEGSQPGLHLTDTNNNDDFLIYNNNGILKVYDSTDGADRLSIASNGRATFANDVGINGNLDVGSGLDVTGNITVTGTVDGVDVAALNTTVGNLGISNGAIASGTTAVTQGQSANNTQIATTAYVRTAITNAQAFPSGTKMLFQQTSAPTGWTKITSGVNNKALRVVSGTAGSGGNIAFTTVFAARGITANAGNTTQGGNISVANTTAGGNVSISSVSTSGTVNSHTLSTNEMPSHYHSIHGNKYGNYYGWEANHSGIFGLDNRSYDQQGQNNRTSTNAGRTENTGGGGGHSHGFSGSSHTHNGSLTGTAHTHNATFSGSAHNHSISVSNLDMQAEYLDVIIASKD